MTDKELIQALRCESGNCLNCGLADVCFSLDAQAADHLEALLAENEHLREATKMVGEDTNVPTKWVSVSKRLPESDGLVLVTFTGKIQNKEYIDGYLMAEYVPEKAGFWKNIRSWRTRMLHTGANSQNRPALRGWSE